MKMAAIVSLIEHAGIQTVICDGPSAKAISNCAKAQLEQIKAALHAQTTESSHIVILTDIRYLTINTVFISLGLESHLATSPPSSLPNFLFWQSS